MVSRATIKRLFFISLAALLVVVGLQFAQAVFAQDVTGTDSLTTVGTTAGLQAEDPRLIIGRIIRVGLGFLGVVTLAIIIYGGFLYMTAGGSEQQTEKAKHWIINAVIGLAIILMSYSITSYIINGLTAATGVGTGTETSGGDGGGGGLGGGSGSMIAGFTVNVSPKGPNRPITSVVTVQFPTNKDIPSDSDYKNAKESVKLYSLTMSNLGVESETEIPGTIAVSGKKIVFTPDGACPAGCGKDHCLAANTKYRVKVLQLQSTDKDQVACPTQLQGYCASVNFATNDKCDLTGPVVDIVAPVTPVKQGDVFDIETTVTDESGVTSTTLCAQKDKPGTCTTATPEGDTTPTEFPYTFGVDTFEYPLGWTTTHVTGVDAGNNESVATKKYLVASDSCFNTKNQFDCALTDCEIDCTTTGTDPNNPNYICVETPAGGTECKPWPYPIISSVKPTSGPVGSFVTIRGSNFGTFGAQSTVSLNGKPAGMACGNTYSWSPTSIVVRVPEGGTSGAIKITNSKGEYNDTGDTTSPGWKGSYSVTNATDWIGLCAVRKQDVKVDEKNWVATGAFGDAVAAFGSNFGTKGAADTVMFDGQQTFSVGSWTTSKISDIRVPSLNSGTTSVQIAKGDVYSNPVPFMITEQAEAPTITSIAPNPAPPQQLITINGKNFGTGGAVNFVNKDTGVSLNGVIGCQGGWTNTQITVEVPADAADGAYTIRIVVGKKSVQGDFVVDANVPVKPGICQISPNNGPAGTKVTIQGSGFGTTPGSIVFSKNQVIQSGALTSSGSTWTDSVIADVVVPPTVETGDVFVANVQAAESNKVKYSVGSCTANSCGAGLICCQNAYCSTADQCTVTKTTSEYAWVFSTGAIPQVPKIIDRTCVKSVYNQSPSPAKNTQEACPNGSVAFAFNMEMMEDSLRDHVEIRQCNRVGEPCNLDLCDAANCTSSEYRFTDTLEELRTSTFNNQEVTEVNLSELVLAPNFWYQVTVKSGVLSASATGESLSLPNDYSWKFKTSSQDCVIDSLVVNPSAGKIQEIIETQKYSVNGQAAACDKIDVDNATWTVTKFSEKIVDVTPPNMAKSNSLFGVNKTAQNPETPPGQPGEITASVVANGKTLTDTATLAIEFRDPRVVTRWPDCEGACVNAQIGASFNTFMDKRTFTPSSVQVLKCLNKECSNGSTPIALNADVATIAGASPAPNDSNAFMDIVVNFLSNQALSAGSYYRVVLDKSVTSISGKSLTNLNYNTAAVQTVCGNGILEAGESCEAACKDTSGVLCLPNNDGSYPQGCSDCNISYNPYCNANCTAKRFTICGGGNTQNCCGNGIVETYADKLGKEQCEGTCTKLATKDFTAQGTQTANEVCKDYILNNQDAVAATGCSCQVPTTCADNVKTCANVCLENPKQTCTADSSSCTCGLPKVCSQNPTQLCTGDTAPCTCAPEKACEGAIAKSCTSSAQCGGKQCLEVGHYNFKTDVKCFTDSTDPNLGACVKAKVCSEDVTDNKSVVRTCTESKAACSCVPLKNGTATTCAAAGVPTVCPATCSVPVKAACQAGEPGCSCNFPSTCDACTVKGGNAPELQSLYDSYSWVFRTRDDGSVCTVDSVDVKPTKLVTATTLTKYLYVATPKTVPDSCSADGQKLNPLGYTWDWSEPNGKAVVTSAMSIDTSVDANKVLLAIFTQTAYEDAAGGCTNACLNAGSAIYGATCGNGKIEAGEECDDANAKGGDGCSSTCLHEGTKGCFGTGASQCCGNGVKEANEDCDDADQQSGDGCSKSCLNEGSVAGGFTCGNKKQEIGEDADFGSAVNAKFGLNTQCLFTGSKYSIATKISVCGNGLPLESGEECELTSCVDPAGAVCVAGTENCVCSVSADNNCTNRCLFAGFAKCSGTVKTNCCGNGDPLEGNEECEASCTKPDPADVTKDVSCKYGSSPDCVCRFPSSCSDSCLHTGSNPAQGYFCGNGKSEPGEDSICEKDKNIAKGKTGPYALVQVLGYLGQGLSTDTAKITAKADGKEGFGDLTYMGACSADQSAPQIDTAADKNLCRNAEITMRFFSVVRSKGQVPLTKANVSLKYFSKDPCPEDKTTNWCDVSNYRVDARDVEVMKQTSLTIGPILNRDELFSKVIQTELSIMLTDGSNALAAWSKDTQYKVVFRNVVNACNEVYKTIPDQTITTGDQFCRFDRVDVDPAYRMETEADASWNIQHLAKFGNQTLVPLTGIYYWDWKDWVSNDTSLVGVTTNNSLDNPDMARVFKKNGSTNIAATAEIKVDTLFGENGKAKDGTDIYRTVTGAGAVDVFICENVWQWSDDATDNARLLYCRDQGEADDKSDDLPRLKVVRAADVGGVKLPVFNVQDIGTKERATFFLVRADETPFPNTNDKSTDAISFRVFDNKDHLSAREWYSTYVPNPSANVNDVTFACDEDMVTGKQVCYHGVQDGRTVYISAGNITNVNTENAELFNNIYVLGYNDKANPTTINMVDQLLKYIRFNMNVISVGSDQYQVVKRDIVRMNDVTDIQSAVTMYRDQISTNPTLAGGTYVKGQSFSTWPSWQQALGQELGMTLPVDPINTFKQYAAGKDKGCTTADCACTNPDKAGESTGLECLSGDQCVKQKDNYICSVCAAGSDPTTCFDSGTKRVAFDGSEYVDSYLYQYIFTSAFQFTVNYNLEGEGVYYQVQNKP